MDERIRTLIKKALAATNDLEGARITEELRKALHEYLEQTRDIARVSFSPNSGEQKKNRQHKKAA